MEFLKVHGSGNDFVLLPDLDDRLQLTASLARALSDRHRGIGGDGVIRLGAPRPGSGAAVFMDHRNADGSRSEMCGNGVRCVAKYIGDRDSSLGRLLVDTRGGVKAVVVQRGADGLVARCNVDMGAPVIGKVAEPFTVGDVVVEVTTLSMGNPHAVVVVDDVGAAPVATLGHVLATHPAFPDGTNVEFIAATGPDRLAGRIHERGVGETLASGTGASAMAVAGHLLGLVGRRVAVDLPGGRLDLEWTETTVFVTGPAVEVARGELDAAWLAAAAGEQPATREPVTA